MSVCVRRFSFAAVAVVVAICSARAQDSNPLLEALSGPRDVRHVQVSWSASAPTVRPGGAVTLSVYVKPLPGIHVYAPEAKGYLPVALNVGPVRQATVGKTIYPKSEVVLFAELNERVPVYSKAFDLSRVLTAAPTARPGTQIHVSGTVDVQACDDKVCYPPEKAPVSWSITVR